MPAVRPPIRYLLLRVRGSGRSDRKFSSTWIMKVKAPRNYGVLHADPHIAVKQPAPVPPVTESPGLPGGPWRFCCVCRSRWKLVPVQVSGLDAPRPFLHVVGPLSGTEITSTRYESGRASTSRRKRLARLGHSDSKHLKWTVFCPTQRDLRGGYCLLVSVVIG